MAEVAARAAGSEEGVGEGGPAAVDGLLDRQYELDRAAERLDAKAALIGLKTSWTVEARAAGGRGDSAVGDGDGHSLARQ